MNSRIKIGLYTPTYPGITGDGGIGTYTRLQANAFSELGYEVHVLVPGETNRNLKDGLVNVHLVKAAHIPVLDRIIPGYGRVFHIDKAARQLVRQFKLDIFEFPNWDGIGSLFSRRQLIPFIVRLCTSAKETQMIDGINQSRHSKLDVAREHWQAKAANALVTHSYAHRDNMSRELNIDKKSIHVIPIGIKTFGDYSRTHIENKDKIIVFLGRMEKRKGSIDLLIAFSIVSRIIPDVKLVMIGNDRPHCPGDRTHRQFISDEFPLEIQEKIVLLGSLPEGEVNEWLQRATVFVAPSLYESFGIIFLEAMRWEIPVIGTDVGGIPEIIDDGVTGILTLPSQPEKLAAAIVRMLSSDEYQKALAKNGRKKVEESFTIEIMASRMIDFYHDTILNAESN